jgi:hypothetical protein
LKIDQQIAVKPANMKDLLQSLLNIQQLVHEYATHADARRNGYTRGVPARVEEHAPFYGLNNLWQRFFIILPEKKSTRR